MLKLSQLFRIGESLGKLGAAKVIPHNDWIIPVAGQLTSESPLFGGSVRYARFKEHLRELPKAGEGYFRRTVHYPEKYTIKPIPYTNLAGRDPVSGTKD